MVYRHCKDGTALREKIRSVVLLHPSVDGLHSVDEGCELVYGGITPGGIDTDIPEGSQALDEAPYLPVINAAPFECGIERRDARGCGTPGDSILCSDARQVSF